MGALTLKTHPFEIRSWENEIFESFDPTNSFGSNIIVYLNKNKIIQIEPDYNLYTNNHWLTDKSRLFFDGIFNTKYLKKKESWLNLLYKLIKTIYIFDQCSKQTNKNYFFTIIFNNLNFELLCMLIYISQKYSFIILKKTEQININLNLESFFQLNNITENLKLSFSTLCLFISTNTRYEGYYLNLKLRQRYLKGNFKCLNIGSLIDLSFKIEFLGSNFSILKTIAEGNNFLCQDLKFSNNPILIYNNEIFKRNDNKNIFEILKILFKLQIFHKTWNGLNVLNSTLNDTGTFILKYVSKLTLKNFNNFSSLFFFNLISNNLFNIIKVAKLKLLFKSFIIPQKKCIQFNFINFKNKQFLTNKLILNQNVENKINLTFSKKQYKNCFYISKNIFFENEATYINAEGFVKRAIKLISKKKTKNSWQFFKKMLIYFKKKLVFLITIENQILFYNFKKFYNFKNFINFQYYVTQSLTNLNFYLNIKNKTIILKKSTEYYKTKTKKYITTKIKYWLDDFFNGNKDEYSQNSIILTDYSKILRIKYTNFFF